jgi:hypothetical protein
MEAIAEPYKVKWLGPPGGLEPEEVIAGKYPVRYGFIRRIVPLWGPFFRVNFIRKDGSIPESHFLMVKDGEIKEVK